MPVHYQDQVYQSVGGGGEVDRVLKEFQENAHVPDCMVWRDSTVKPELYRNVRQYDPETRREVIKREPYHPRPFNRPPELGKSRQFVPEDERTQFEFRPKKSEPGVADSMIWWPTAQNVMTRIFEKTGRKQPGTWRLEEPNDQSMNHHETNLRDDHHHDNHAHDNQHHENFQDGDHNRQGKSHEGSFCGTGAHGSGDHGGGHGHCCCEWHRRGSCCHHDSQDHHSNNDHHGNYNQHGNNDHYGNNDSHGDHHHQGNMDGLPQERRYYGTPRSESDHIRIASARSASRSRKPLPNKYTVTGPQVRFDYM